MRTANFFKVFWDAAEEDFKKMLDDEERAESDTLNQGTRTRKQR